MTRTIPLAVSLIRNHSVPQGSQSLCIMMDSLWAWVSFKLHVLNSLAKTVLNSLEWRTSCCVSSDIIWLDCKCGMLFHFNLTAFIAAALYWSGHPNQACFVLFGCVWDSTVNVIQHLVQAVWVVCNVSLLLWLAWPSIIYCMSLPPQVRVEREGIFSGLRCPSLSLVCVGSLAERHLCAALSCYCCTCVCLCVCF